MRIRSIQHIKILIYIALIIACSNGNQALIEQNDIPKSILLSSTVFSDGGAIPSGYTCDGKDASPELKWKNIPNGAKSLALICDDPDAPAGTWTHWVIFNISAKESELPEGISASEQVLGNAKQGINDFKKIGYGGPCPPPGNEHRYYFKIYALDAELNLNAGVTKDQVMNAMKNPILSEGQLIGTYRK